MDVIARALTVGDPGRDYPDNLKRIYQAARRAAIKAAFTSTYTRDHDVWIIDTMPTRARRLEYRQHRIGMVTVDPGRDVCIERARAERPAHMLAVIDEWYAANDG